MASIHGLKLCQCISQQKIYFLKNFIPRKEIGFTIVHDASKFDLLGGSYITHLRNVLCVKIPRFVGVSSLPLHMTLLRVRSDPTNCRELYSLTFHWLICQSDHCNKIHCKEFLNYCLGILYQLSLSLSVRKVRYCLRKGFEVRFLEGESENIIHLQP